jgi:hypothetical protein
MNDKTRPSENNHSGETCQVCGGDRRIGNSFGLTTTCPSCHGSGQRAETTGFHDVTKTKASHYRSNVAPAAAAKPQWPTTFEGAQLAKEIRDSATCTEAVRAKLLREVIDFEASHGQCTQTFIKKVRKQVRPHPSP